MDGMSEVEKLHLALEVELSNCKDLKTLKRMQIITRLYKQRKAYLESSINLIKGRFDLIDTEFKDQLIRNCYDMEYGYLLYNEKTNMDSKNNVARIKTHPKIDVENSKTQDIKQNPTCQQNKKESVVGKEVTVYKNPFLDKNNNISSVPQVSNVNNNHSAINTTNIDTNAQSKHNNTIPNCNNALSRYNKNSHCSHTEIARYNFKSNSNYRRPPHDVFQPNTASKWDDKPTFMYKLNNSTIIPSKTTTTPQEAFTFPQNSYYNNLNSMKPSISSISGNSVAITSGYKNYNEGVMDYSRNSNNFNFQGNTGYNHNLENGKKPFSSVLNGNYEVENNKTLDLMHYSKEVNKPTTNISIAKTSIPNKIYNDTREDINASNLNQLLDLLRTVHQTASLPSLQNSSAYTLGQQTLSILPQQLNLPQRSVNALPSIPYQQQPIYQEQGHFYDGKAANTVNDKKLKGPYFKKVSDNSTDVNKWGALNSTYKNGQRQVYSTNPRTTSEKNTNSSDEKNTKSKFTKDLELLRGIYSRSTNCNESSRTSNRINDLKQKNSSIYYGKGHEIDGGINYRSGSSFRAPNHFNKNIKKKNNNNNNLVNNISDNNILGRNKHSSEIKKDNGNRNNNNSGKNVKSKIPKSLKKIGKIAKKYDLQ
ncbi:uncharacterized protein SCDLUD_001793 [Saccharomycodes ludwigii]|uniref:uncharacterized protein n=1 Tax=Saccharomycodes ludwigii TaxID=36035 RepID=UPI001E8BAE42|nr:hypothetical protein SCDLUD_001793 [Saccharomycodes ludwigii]KAH3902005.1 hypothetical protein SCDLUD_001793 [Saccharomycodes ludwigii]